MTSMASRPTREYRSRSILNTAKKVKLLTDMPYMRAAPGAPYPQLLCE
jgi:hypothetical protein